MALFGLMVSEPLGIVVGWEQRWGAAPSGALELLRLHACKQRAQERGYSWPLVSLQQSSATS